MERVPGSTNCLESVFSPRYPPPRKEGGGACEDFPPVCPARQWTSIEFNTLMRHMSG